MPVNLPQLTAAAKIIERLERDGSGAIELVGPWGSGKTLAAAQIAEALERPLLVLAHGRVESEGIFEDLSTFVGEERCALFPAWEVLPSDLMDPADDIVAERMNTLLRIIHSAEEGRAVHVVAPARSLLQAVVRPERLVRDTLELRVGDERDLEELVQALSRLGYERELMVEQRGQMSVRGGIFDVFPISEELPIRVEFFGDEIESIRRFEPETQRSLDRQDRVRILPRSEKSLLREAGPARAKLAAVCDFMPEDTLVVIDEPVAFRQESAKLSEQFAESPYFMSAEEAGGHLGRFARIEMAQVAYTGAPTATRMLEPMRSMQTWGGHTEDFWAQLSNWESEGYTVQLVCNNTGECGRLIELLEERGHRIGNETFDLRVTIGRLRAGFTSPQDKLAVLSEREMFGRHYVRRIRRRFEAGAAITAFSDLKSGDYIVHVHHGIGRYLGLKRFAGKSGDYLALQYRGGDKVYLPVTHVDMVQKYVAGEGGAPKIDKLGGATWAKTKARVKKAVKDMTDELVKLYAERESREGHAFTPDTPWQVEFEDSFEYDETPDQMRAIDDVKRDMEHSRPMDRLLCGDVGYGKTEVALRAAFKAVMDGKQAAVLAPTTILAEQHYNTFRERLADYPVKIDMLSRFRKPAEIKATIERLKSGEVDIVIGTHRLLSRDIQFKDLGLVVLDEEQRFGVAQKEKLKQMRTVVDVLTMSATPIPRTLNMALLGARDMSAINTAPNDRLPVHTLIANFDEQLVAEAIERELAREGQVFFLHNRVQTILPMATLVRKLVPQARVAIGHGQMPEHELESVMTAFIHHEIDVLVCTTIIGSGVDIPNANTIIINNADQFGLAELYQLRGRVGRYKHRAFAYLLVPGDRALSEDAQKRLKALEEFSTLGSGFRLAMRDLEIRGCGNILGGEQHGHIAAVGFDAYTHLVAEAVAELKGQPYVRRTLPPFEIAVDAYIPEEYVPSEAQKITLYKRIAAVLTDADVDEMAAELEDRFGAPPGPVRRLLDVMRVRALAGELGAKQVSAGGGLVRCSFGSGHLLTRQAKGVLGQHFGDRVAFSWEGDPNVTLKTSATEDETLLDAARELLQALSTV